MKRPDDVRRTVNSIDGTRTAEFFRNPDRPDGRAVPRRAPPRDPEIIRAQSRLRVAAWRADQDRKGAPTATQIGMSLAVALARTENIDALTAADPGIVGRMLTDLQHRGFDIAETLATLKRLRSRVRAAETVKNRAAGPGRR